MMMHIAPLTTPIGILYIGTTDKAVVLCDWASRRNNRQFIQRVSARLGLKTTEGETPLTDLVKSQLHEYFSGSRQTFDLPLHFSGTPFQESVWHAIAMIPYGTTVSYSDISRRIGRPGAVRAVANAIGANRLSVILPCHRVTAVSSLGGYAGGTNVKRALLDLEI
ncbi:MAG: methylated-DNA--[protein]-cysteine S-methyltransferase [Muribaculaceae bacterium]|nr:methylated-DNA--[protein]-cysteine S-methyltransferase [Muribaculaceae bacterium]